jgi:alpha-galactosidase
MKKITFIGAGSFGFTRNLAKDILSFPAFSECEICLMDINPKRLEYIKMAVDKIVEAGGYKAKVIATTDRAEALKGADGILITILAGGTQVWRHDIEIPKKYGVDLNVGDTRGPAGIFRFLRTAPVMLDICWDIEKYCPDAVVLNYTNPMAMLCRIMQGQSGVNVTGLCHSVQETSLMLSEWIGAKYEDITYLCAGINHLAWFLEYKWNGKDAYPLIREAIKSRTEVYNTEIVRNEMFLHLDYYVTESSGHNSEYNAWFRKRPDLIEKYCTHGTGWNPGVYAYNLNEYLSREDTWEEEIKTWLNEPIELERGSEYAAYIFNAVFGDNTMFEFNGNVRNFGLIENLPYGCCVEVPVTASKAGLRSVHVGMLPDHLAILNNINSQIEEIAVNASIKGDARSVFQAICMDPLTSAVLSLEEIEKMVREMFDKNRDYLPQFKNI